MTAAELKALPAGRLPEVAADLRREIVATVAKTGGHLASSLGAVELTLGLLRVFDPSRDRVVWDVGHQTYAWKLLTGRREAFGTLRAFGGISGFCNPDETPCDAFVSGHAGNALAAAEGLAVARDLRGGRESVVAVVGDASLANGESWEALANCASLKSRLILVVNDNEMGISRNAGSFIRASFFEPLGLRYVGPVDGHDAAALERAFREARGAGAGVVVHVLTEKGRGFAPAEADPTAWHGVGAFDADNPVLAASSPSWSDVFGRALVELAEADGRICALTAAMRDGTGLAAFSERFPSRFFDCGICEGQMATFAAGLAKGGLRPVVAVYSSFLQRAVDQVMHDVCLLRLPVVFAVDRAGCVGADGRTHHGVFDVPMLKCLPGISIMQPKDAADLKAMLAAAVAKGGPAVVRYPRGVPPASAAEPVPVEWGRAVQMSRPDAKLQFWALGDQVQKAVAVARILERRGVAAGVVDARFAKPFDAGLLARHRAAGATIASIENGAALGGFGESIGADVRFGWPDEFVGHGSVAELERAAGFTAEDIAERF